VRAIWLGRLDLENEDEDENDDEDDFRNDGEKGSSAHRHTGAGFSHHSVFKRQSRDASLTRMTSLLERIALASSTIVPEYRPF
jgi:hypothetical protein